MATNPTGRRLRIGSMHPGSTEGYLTTVQDADTGEHIGGISRIVLTLDASNQNEVEVTYFEVDKKGHIIVDPDNESNPLMKTTKVQNVEIDDITAFEIMDNIRKEMR